MEKNIKHTKIKKKFKVLAASDLHGDSDLAKKLAAKAEKEKVDLVVLCGDLTQSEKSTEGIIGPFTKKNKKVVLIPGNHESIATADFLAELYGATNLHGYSIKLNDIGFFGCSGTNSGIHKINDKETFDLLKKGYRYIRGARKKVMVTHVHPSNTNIERFSSFVHGSEGVSKALKSLKPDILLCGHVHEASGIEEKIGKIRIINVGRNGSIIEI